MTTHDDPNQRGVWPAIGSPSESDLAKERDRARRYEVVMVLGFLGALGVIAAFVCWCMNWGKF
jgi:hypothetical protein